MARYKARKFQALGVPRKHAKVWAKAANRGERTVRQARRAAVAQAQAVGAPAASLSTAAISGPLLMVRGDATSGMNARQLSQSEKRPTPTELAPSTDALLKAQAAPAGAHVIPERAALHAAAIALQKSQGIGYSDAAELILEQTEVADPAAADTGSTGLDHTDTSYARPPALGDTGWSEADWQRDQRRAQAAGVDVSKETWQAGAELGVDVVHEEARRMRQATRAAAQQGVSAMLANLSAPRTSARSPRKISVRLIVSANAQPER